LEVLIRQSFQNAQGELHPRSGLELLAKREKADGLTAHDAHLFQIQGAPFGRRCRTVVKS
jgi:hypothetical protein